MTGFLVCNVSWMEKYQGEALSESGGSYVKDTKDGAEKFNFQPHEGQVFGYVGTRTRTIDCNKLGQCPAMWQRPSVDGVTVVWTAKHKKRAGVYVVGWYLNATVFRDLKNDPAGRKMNNGELRAYNIKADEQDAKYLDENQRTVQVPRGGLGRMGQNNTWRADSQAGMEFRRDFELFRRQIERTVL